MSEIVTEEGQSDKTSILFRETAKGFVEGIFGLAASDRKDLILSLGYIFQRTRSGTFLNALLKEWAVYREKGRIKEDYIQSEQHQECLQEMLDFLDRDSPDALRFRMLKAIFLGAATENQSSKDSVLPQQYMGICRTLSSGEALVLQATFEIAEQRNTPSSNVAREWLAIIAEESGLESNELVDIHERRLIDKNLLTDRVHGDRSGVNLGKYYRLTPLALSICRFIKNFEDQNMG
jgi:hypothetical protein